MLSARTSFTPTVHDSEALTAALRPQPVVVAFVVDHLGCVGALCVRACASASACLFFWRARAAPSTSPLCKKKKKRTDSSSLRSGSSYWCVLACTRVWLLVKAKNDDRLQARGRTCRAPPSPRRAHQHAHITCVHTSNLQTAQSVLTRIESRYSRVGACVGAGPLRLSAALEREGGAFFLDGASHKGDFVRRPVPSC